VQVLPLRWNGGPAWARNIAIGRAVGDYVAILDADDIAVPERIEKQVAFIEEHEADVVGSFYRVINSRGEVIGRREVPTTAEGIRRSFVVFNPVANPTILARAAVMKEHPYPDQRLFEDYEFWVRLARANIKILNQNEYLTLFRNDENFVGRRRGWPFFLRELRCKTLALRLYPVYTRPFVLGVILVSSIARLLPPALFRRLHALRGKLRFGKAS
jgi:glycosyltransferase involved in cell wall biosynthesis